MNKIFLEIFFLEKFYGCMILRGNVSWGLQILALLSRILVCVIIFENTVSFDKK